MIRITDFLLAVFIACILSWLILAVALLVRLTSTGPIIYWSVRVGKNNSHFMMPKFRTMYIHTPVLATHLIEDPHKYLTGIGGFLRKASLDELPQLWSIVKGDMSFVGPRPALFNQVDLIELRTNLGIDTILPGLTGWAQINGRDELPINQKVKFDYEYLQKRSVLFNLIILWKTLFRIINRDGILH